MLQIDKKEIKSQFGLLKDSIVGMANCLDGLPDIRPGDVVTISIYEKGVVFSVSSLLKSRYYAISNSDLEAVEYEPWDVIKEKERSVLGRAVVGAILFGPVGAIIGGLSGVKNKKIFPDYALVFASKSGDKVIFNIKAKDADKVSKIIRKNFASFLI